MLLGNSNCWLNLPEIQINGVLLIGQQSIIPCKLFYHQRKSTLSLIREFWDTCMYYDKLEISI
jgi:hypothetical protein